MEGQEDGGLLGTLWGAGAESISCIERIGAALLRGFVLSLLEREGGLPRRVPREELGGEEGEEAAVASLGAAALRVWGRLSRDPEMDSLVGALAGRPPLPALAGVSEQLFRDGINWGRVIVFFYFTYRVVLQSRVLASTVLERNRLLPPSSVRLSIHPSVRPSVHPSACPPARHGLPGPPELPPRLRGRHQPHGQHGAPRLLRVPLHGVLLRAGRRGPAAPGAIPPGAVARGAGTRRGAPALPDAPRRPRAAARHQEAGAGRLGLGAGGHGGRAAAGEVGEPGSAGPAPPGHRQGGPPPLRLPRVPLPGRAGQGHQGAGRPHHQPAAPGWGSRGGPQRPRRIPLRPPQPGGAQLNPPTGGPWDTPPRTPPPHPDPVTPLPHSRGLTCWGSCTPA
ncbi:proline-rich protein HaeIII subfamily 1-like isoform X2 [Nyctibius grandis]|uniref:proline-rich protein HaeIII subfamily 1-like isoform X2 n=1 Tax=Nyctibius grandis TaxID=48427 RepID=UPI0035BBA665